MIIRLPMPNPLNLRVFLSSPGDLSDERRLARQAMEALSRSELLRGRICFEVVAWDDEHASTPMDASEALQTSVNRYTGRPAECDLTLVILWGRIDTRLPEGLTRTDGTPFVSGTVWEYEDAIAAGKPVFIYRRTEKVLIDVDDPNFVKKRAEYAEVQAFFDRFANPDDSQKVGFNTYATPSDFERILRQHLEAFVNERLNSAATPGTRAVDLDSRATNGQRDLPVNNDMIGPGQAVEATRSTHATTNAQTGSQQARPSALLPLIVAGFAAMVGIGLLGVMLWAAPMLVRLGLVGHVWYALLIALGLSAAITVFALFKSYARYTGKILDGTVVLGGPALVMLIVIVLGFELVPPPLVRFDVTVFLHGEAGRQAQVLRNQGRLSLDLGADRRTEPVGDKGEVRFIGIPSDQRERVVGVTLDAEKYELVNSNLDLTLDREVHYISVRPKSLRLIGAVADQDGQPIAKAAVNIADKSTLTNEDGRFEIQLPADLPELDRTLTIRAQGYAPWSAQATPGGNLLRARLTPME